MKIIKTFFIWVLFSLFLVTPVSAQSEIIKSFDVQIVAQSDGSMDMTETIVVDFHDISHHGIYRYIPTVTKVGDLYRKSDFQLTSVTRDDKKEVHTTTRNNNQLYLKIGNPDKTITGEHTYTIVYTVKNGVGSNYTDHDEIYWNITGNGWEWPILKATATLSAPVSFDKAICFTGSAGSTSKACTTSDNKFQTNSHLLPGEGLTIVASYPVGTFPKSTLQKNEPGSFTEFISNPLVQILGIGTLVSLNFGLAPYALYWYGQNRSKKKYGPPTVNFDFPTDGEGKRIAPLEAGIMDSTKIEQDDVLATIYDLAIRKYVKVEQIQKDHKLLGIKVGGKEEFVIKKLKDYPDLQSFERTLLDRLFQDGDEVEIKSLKADFYKTFSDMEEDAFSVLKKKGFYTKNPKNQKGGLVVAGIFSLIALSPILAGVLFYLAVKMNGRTQLGDSTDWNIDGLKLFLKGRGREYNWNAKNLHVVEGMIPYAVALGYIDQFIKEFQIHYPDYNPTWYGGYSGSNFSFANTAFMSSFSSSITTSAPSSSSGFSGGSSGGGGGGGGGGGW